jgi:hypothetical protein
MHRRNIKTEHLWTASIHYGLMDNKLKFHSNVLIILNEQNQMNKIHYPDLHQISNEHEDYITRKEQRKSNRKFIGQMS